MTMLSPKFVLEFAAVLIVGVLNHAAGVIFSLKRADFPKLFTASEQLLRLWIGAMSGIVVALLVAIGQPKGFASIGIQPEDAGKNWSAMLGGWFAVSVLIIASGLIYRLIRYKRNEVLPPVPDKPWIAEQLRYRDRWERCAYLTVLTLVVISEDLIYRGYFVLLLGRQTGTFTPWVILSVVLSVIIHLYQGHRRQTVIFHLIAASFLVGITVITQNLLAPIAAHLYYDLIMTAQIWKLEKQREGASLPVVHSRVKKAALLLFSGVNIILLCSAVVWLLL